MYLFLYIPNKSIMYSSCIRYWMKELNKLLYIFFIYICRMCVGVYLLPSLRFFKYLLWTHVINHISYMMMGGVTHIAMVRLYNDRI